MPGDAEFDAEDATIAAYLESLPSDTLRARLTAVAATYEPLRRRLLTEAQAAGGTVDVPALKKELTALMRVSTRHEHYYGSRDYADESQTAIDVVAGVLDAGAPDAAIVLAEHLLKRFETALGRLDDSGGFLAWPINQVCEIHRAACIAAQPDPRKLATRLFELAMASDWELFIDAPEQYADVLADDGLDAYAVLLDRAAAQIPGRGESAERRLDPTLPRRFVVTHLRESLARARGDVDGLVAVMSEDLSSPFAYLRIAGELQAADRRREALSWLERSIIEFGPDADARVLDETLDAYLGDGQEADALALAERAFDADATAESYATARASGGRDGRLAPAPRSSSANASAPARMAGTARIARRPSSPRWPKESWTAPGRTPGLVAAGGTPGSSSPMPAGPL